MLFRSGGSIHASPFPWKGLPNAARRGWLPFETAKPPSLPFPSGKGVVSRKAVDRVLSQTAHLRRSPSLFFTPPSPSNLRPFGAPPSIGRRECPREPLSMEGATERSEAGLVSFWGGEAPSSLPFPSGKGVVSRKALSSYRSLPLWGRGTA